MASRARPVRSSRSSGFNERVGGRLTLAIAGVAMAGVSLDFHPTIAAHSNSSAFAFDCADLRSSDEIRG
jgi:hypothetical protein